MRLTDIPAQVLNDVTRKWRRRAIAGAIVAACALGVLIEGVAAIRRSLEPSFGPIGARLLLVLAFALIIAVTLVVVLLIERRSDKRAETVTGSLERNVKSDDRTVLIAEAIDLGYALAQGIGRRKPPPAREPEDATQAHHGASPREAAE